MDRFLPSFDPENIRFRASVPISQAGATLGAAPYSYFRYENHLAALEALAVHDEVTRSFADQFGRTYEAVESYRLDDAEFAYVIMGSFATKAKEAVDQLRAEGWKIGLLRPRLLRPFPEKEFIRALGGKKGVAVIDQNISMGKGGVLHTELASALLGQKVTKPALVSFIGGLGGRDISSEEFFEMAQVTKNAAATGEIPPPRLLYTETELREVRKLQAIAHVERFEEGK